MKGQLQDPSVSASSVSSSRRESSPAVLPDKNIPAKSIGFGCMSGIFQLVYKPHNPRRFLTFGKKQEKDVISSETQRIKLPKAAPILMQPSSKSNSSSILHDEEEEMTPASGPACDINVPRSPSLAAEIRRSRSLNNQNFQAPALVARLMGLSDVPNTRSSGELEVAEERRRLLEALEKCDEDLKALKKIIESVVGDTIYSGSFDEFERRDQEGRNPVEHHQLLQAQQHGHSPLCVLDARSPFSAHSTRNYTINGGVPQQQQKHKKKKKPGAEDIANICFFDRIISNGMNNNNNIIIYGKSDHQNVVAVPLWTSKAMIQSVNEVCRDIAWGERREAGRIGLALQDYICRDLIEEIVKEMGFDCICQPGPLPFESCKRRLRF